MGGNQFYLNGIKGGFIPVLQPFFVLPILLEMALEIIIPFPNYMHSYRVTPDACHGAII